MISKFRLTLALCLTTSATSLLLAEQTSRVHHYSGEEWLSWNALERDIYVRGYIDGNRWGTSRVCRDADDLFETTEEHHQGDATHPSDFPSARCLAKRPTYSKAGHDPRDLTGLAVYTGVITEFYTKHPEYRRVPFVFLMMYLNDQNFKTANQLYEMARKGYMNSVFLY